MTPITDRRRKPSVTWISRISPFGEVENADRGWRINEERNEEKWLLARIAASL